MTQDTQNQPPALKAWHQYAETGNVDILAAALAEDAVFESPVVHTPQRGRAITLKYLTTAFEVLGAGDFKYLNEWRNETSAILEFSSTIDGIAINGIDMITWNAAGQITHFKVMVRPLKAINLLHQLMMKALLKETA